MSSHKLAQVFDPNRGLRSRGALAVVSFVAVSSLVVAAGAGAFDEAVNVDVATDRAGLLLEPGADVSLRNVSIGKVDSVETSEAGAVLALDLEPEFARHVPANSAVRIVSPTLLGPKYVDFVPPASAPAPGLEDGDTVRASTVQVEANAAFENLVRVLDGVRPMELQTALGAIARTVDTRGNQLGVYLERANAYLARFNKSLPAMERDTAMAHEVTSAYARIAPDLLSFLDATTATGESIVDQEEALDAVLVSLRQTSDTTREFLARTDVPLDQAMHLLRPSTTTLARYAPMFPCLFEGLNRYRKSVEPASGGVYPGLWVRLTVLPGVDPYVAPENLPRVAADSPTCAVARQSNGWYVPRPYADGAPPLDNTGAPLTTQDRRPLALQLFGDEVPLGEVK